MYMNNSVLNEVFQVYCRVVYIFLYFVLPFKNYWVLHMHMLMTVLHDMVVSYISNEERVNLTAAIKINLLFSTNADITYIHSFQ